MMKTLASSSSSCGEMRAGSAVARGAGVEIDMAASLADGVDLGVLETQGSQAWTQHTQSFLASGPGLLQFRSLDAGNYDRTSFVDGINLTQVAQVPEPLALVLAGLVVGLFAAVEIALQALQQIDQELALGLTQPRQRLDAQPLRLLV